MALESFDVTHIGIWATHRWFIGFAANWIRIENPIKLFENDLNGLKFYDSFKMNYSASGTPNE